MNDKYSINQIERLLNYSKTSKENVKQFDLFLFTISYLLEDKNNEKVVVSYINKLLKSRNDEEVYACLNKIISCISIDTLFENISFWIQQIVNHHQRNEIYTEKYIVISNLIERGKNNQDFNKLVLSSILFKLIEECLLVDIKSFQAESALACLAICLEIYSKSCGPLKNKIELYLLQFFSLKTKNSKLIKKAALCFQKLQKVGSSGPELINHKNNWKNAFEKLCATVATLHDDFFEDIEEFCVYEKVSVEPYILPDLPKVISSTEMLYILENRLENICLFLRGLLEYEFSLPKCIYPQHVIDITTRVLSLHICFNNNSDFNGRFHFSILLLKHQTVILYVLRSLIAVLELNLLPFSAAISKLLVDCLARTQHCSCFYHVSEYKIALYKVLQYWIITLKNCLNANIHDKLVNLIIEDVSSVTKDVSLNISNPINVSGKLKKKALQAKIISSSVKHSSLEDYPKNVLETKEKFCYQALHCLSTLFNNVSLSVKESTLLVLYNTLTKAIMHQHTGKTIFPYNTDRVKSKLYETLLATIECSSPPSINLVINLLKEGQRSTNPSIVLTCCMGFNLLEKICQPVSPSWNFNDHNQPVLNSKETVVEFREEEEVTTLTETSDYDQLQQKELKQNEESEMLQEGLMESNIVTSESQNVSENKTNDERNIHVSNEQAINEEKEISEERSIEKESSINNPQLNEPIVNDSMNNSIENTDKDSNHHLVETDCTEPVQKKMKANDTSLSNHDVDDMLASFVDEVNDNVD